MKKRVFITLTGPSAGVEKTTLINMLFDGTKYPLERINSWTTRPPRDEGESYEYFTKAAFDFMIQNDEFLEFYRPEGDHFYGTPIKPFLSAIESGNIPVKDLEINGVLKLRDSEILRDQEISWTPVLILPTGENLREQLEILEANMRYRGTDTEESIAHKLKRAEGELKSYEDCYHVFGDNIFYNNKDLLEANVIRLNTTIHRAINFE